MAYDTLLADRVRSYLVLFPNLDIIEKQMFSGLAFIVNGKMCVNISGKNLMCRFDPLQTESLAKISGFLPMIMKGKEMKGYCYVEPKGIINNKDFTFWINLCLEFNDKAKKTKRIK